MSIISYSEAAAFIEDEISETNLDFTALCDSIDAWVKAYCRRDFENADYIEYYNGKGLSRLFLDNYPVTALQRISVGRRTGLRVANTNTNTTASATVTASGVVLYYNGTATTLLFADYSTLTLMQAAIEALSGWTAELQNTEDAAILSTELCKSYGRSCINSQWVDLEVPDDAEFDFILDEDTGIIIRGYAWPAGTNYIRVDYTAGYTEDTMPEDLKLSVKILVKDWWEKRAESTFNVSTLSVGGMSKHILKAVPEEALRTLDAYRRHLV